MRYFQAITVFALGICWASFAVADEPSDNSASPALLDKRQQGQVFDEAIHILGGNINVISKWMQPIRLAIVGDAGAAGAVGEADNKSEVVAGQSAAVYARKIIVEVASLTGLKVEKAIDSYRNADEYLDAIIRSPKFTLSDCMQTESVNRACANFFVIFAEPSTMATIVQSIPMRPVYQKAFANPDNVTCFFSPFQTGYMEIRQALVFVRDDLPAAMLQTCLQEEIYQSFGMFNDYTNSRYFSFNNLIEPKVITRYDRALLKTIYDPAFKPGAPAFMVVKKLMDNLGLDPLSEN